MAQPTGAGRRVCPSCGANNFETVPVCWKCGKPLGMSPAAAMPAGSGPGYGSGSSHNHGAGSGREQQPGLDLNYGGGAASAAGDSGAAMRAAVLLGLTIPFLGLPIGWVFIMLEERRRQVIGKACVLWSLIGLVLHMVFFFVAMQWTGSLLMNMLPALIKATSPSRGTEETLPGGSLQPKNGFN